MNKYIILLMIILVVIIFYFTYNYDKKNIEKFSNKYPKKYNNSVINFLANNYLTQSNNGSFALKKSDGTNTDIVVNNGVMSIGSNFSFDPSNNNLKCGSFNIDNDSKIKDNYNNHIGNTDPSGNLIVNGFVYNINNKVLTKNDNSIKVDPSGNILFGQFKYNSGNIYKLNNNNESIVFDLSGNVNLGDYFYSANGTITKSDNSVTVDPSGNINTPDYTVNLNTKDFKKKDGSLTINNGVTKCGDYESDSKISNGNKIKLGNNNYFLNNGIFTNEANTISIDATNVNLNSNKYNYNLTSKVLSGNDNQINKFIISSPPATSITLGATGSVVYNGDGTGKIL